MKIRNKETGQVFEVMAGTLYAKNIFEEVKDDEIKVGNPTVEFEIEKTEPEPVQEEPVKKVTKKATKKAKKGGKANGSNKTK